MKPAYPPGSRRRGPPTGPAAAPLGQLTRRRVVGLFAVNAAPLSLLPRRREEAAALPSILDWMLQRTGGEVEVVAVTNLDADGPGSLAAAATGTTPRERGQGYKARIIRFDVAGRIDLGRQMLFPPGQGRSWCRNTLGIPRSFLWIAGQTAPGRAQGTGSGIEIVGNLTARGMGVVLDHLRVRGQVGGPTYARWKKKKGTRIGYAYDLGKWDPETFNFSWYPRAAPTTLGAEVCVLRNCSFLGARDDPVVVTAKNPYWNEKFVVDNCIIGGALLWRVDRWQRFGTHGDDNYREGKDDVSLAYALNARYNTFKVLYRGNLIHTANYRFPQIATNSSVMVVNNYQFNCGVYSGGGLAAPIHIERNHVGNDSVSYGFHRETRVNATGNLAEGGDRSDFATHDFYYIRNGVPPYDGFPKTKTWDPGDNYLFTYYDPTGLTGKKIKDVNTQLQTEPQISRQAKVPDSDHYDIQHAPTLGLPLGVIDNSFADGTTPVRDHVLTHAGAWPADRDALDRRIVSEVQAKTLPVWGRLPDYTPIATRQGGGAVPPDDLASREGNGLRAVENWLHALHVAAGGWNGHAAAEWVARAGRRS